MALSSTAPTAPAPPAGGAYSSVQTQSVALPPQTLTQEDFLKLLVAQLSAQDPINPVSNAEFIGQMAQFSTLQQTQAMQQNVAGLQASNLLGRTVQVQTSQGQTDIGVVTSVLFNAGSPTFIVNGQSYTLGQVISVSQAPAPAPTQPQPQPQPPPKPQPQPRPQPQPQPQIHL